MSSEIVAVRKPPVEAQFALHPQKKRGICCWCGGVVTEKTEKHGWLKWWHSHCEDEFQIITIPDYARRFVFARDNGICVDCGEDWSEAVRLIPDQYASARSAEAYPDQHTEGPKPGTWVYVAGAGHSDRERHTPYVPLRAISLWHVDHATPLWKVVHMPAIERINYFKLANLLTRCEPCHIVKSRQEAMERGKLNRLAEPEEQKPRSRWGSRKIPKRNDPWGKGLKK